jgi:phosphoserine phosphatase
LDVDIATLFSDSKISSIQAKQGLLHVVALSQKLQPSAITQIATAITAQGGNIERVFRTASYPVTAVEFQVSGASVEELRTSLALVAREVGIDIAVSPGGLARLAKKLVVMDVDSTLIQQEVIELLAAKVGAEKEVIEITKAAMAGELDFESSLRARVALLAGAPEEIIAQVREEIKLTPGARTLVKTLQKLGHEVAVVSGGFTCVIEPLLNELGITNYRANNLEIVDGKLTGQVLAPIIDRAAKGQALRDFAAKVGVTIEQTIAIGDGANDLDMIAAAGLGIAFNAKPAVRAAADSSLSAPYLDSVLYLLGITREDVEAANI